LRPPNEPFELLQVFAIQPVGGPEIHRHPMLDDTVLLENLVEHFERPATVDHEIFGNDLKPVHDRFLFQDVSVMRHTQADADTVLGKTIERICRHDDSLVVRQKKEKRRIGLRFSRYAPKKGANKG
jgi:hypothetical protein